MSDPAGYFIWERGLCGPCPVKISADRYSGIYLSGQTWAALTIGPPVPLTEAQWKMTLKQLADTFPAPTEI